ncbi:MAG: flagellar biosynthesis regulator FlaF [Rhodobacterales bacterium]
MSISAYKNTIRQVESPRQIERRILSRLTGELEAFGAYDTTTTSFERLDILANGLRDALIENQTFWAALKHDLAHPTNALPPELRAGLLSIALWVDQKTKNVLGGQPGVMALVEINRSIIAGLAATPAAHPPAAVAPVAVAQPAYQGR